MLPGQPSAQRERATVLERRAPGTGALQGGAPVGPGQVQPGASGALRGQHRDRCRRSKSRRRRDALRSRTPPCLSDAGLSGPWPSQRADSSRGRGSRDGPLGPQAPLIRRPARRPALPQGTESSYSLTEVRVGGRLTRHDLSIEQLGPATQSQVRARRAHPRTPCLVHAAWVAGHVPSRAERPQRCGACGRSGRDQTMCSAGTRANCRQGARSIAAAGGCTAAPLSSPLRYGLLTRTWIYMQNQPPTPTPIPRSFPGADAQLPAVRRRPAA